MKKTLRNTIMTEEMVVHEKVEEILKEQAMTLNTEFNLDLPKPDIDFETAMSFVKDYASKTKQSVFDLIKSNSFVRKFKSHLLGDSKELDQETKKSEVYSNDPHTIKNILDLSILGFTSPIRISDYQLALIAYALNLFTGKINSRFNKKNISLESKNYKLRHVFKELFLESKHSAESALDFICFCLFNDILYMEDDKIDTPIHIWKQNELFNQISKGTYRSYMNTSSSMGFFIEKILMLSLNEKSLLGKPFRNSEKFMLCIMLMLDNQAFNHLDLEKIYNSDDDKLIEIFIEQILPKTNIESIKQKVINEFINLSYNILNDKNSKKYLNEKEIKYTDKSYDFSVGFKNNTSESFEHLVFVDVKLRSNLRDNLFSTSSNDILNEISSELGAEISDAYNIIKEKGIESVENNNYSNLENKKFINALLYFKNDSKVFKIETDGSNLKINFTEDAVLIKYKLYTFQSLFYEISNSKKLYYSLPENSVTYDKEIKYDESKYYVDTITKEQFKDSYNDNSYIEKFMDYFKSIPIRSKEALLSPYKNLSKPTNIVRNKIFFKAFKDKNKDFKLNQDILAKGFDIKNYYKNNWNSWYDPKNLFLVGDIYLQCRYHFLNAYINKQDINKKKTLHAIMLKNNMLSELYSEYYEYLNETKRYNSRTARAKILQNELFQVLFFIDFSRELNSRNIGLIISDEYGTTKDSWDSFIKNNIDETKWNDFCKYYKNKKDDNFNYNIEWIKEKIISKLN